MSYMHAHYCEACQGYSPCHDYRPLVDELACLLPDPCVSCDRSLAHTPAVSFLTCAHEGTRCAAVGCPNPERVA